MHGNHLRTIAIVGGGLAGWMAAAAFARLLKKDYCRIVLVEEHEPADAGLAEGTTPAFQRFNNLLGISEADFVGATQATFKLGFEFQNWARRGERYFHTFCTFGGVIASVPFHHYWLKLRQLGDETPLEDYSIATVAAKLGRFLRPVEDGKSILSLYSHAYHFDVDRYARYLRDYARRNGVDPIRGTLLGATQRSEDGFLEELVLDGGRRIAADFFIDCTGFPGRLMEKVLKTGIDDWSGWLPCERAVTLSSNRSAPLLPYTGSKADAAGWHLSLPLQDRTEHGYYYSNKFVSDDDAARALLRDAGEGAPTPPRLSQRAIGRPKKFWNKNCLALPGGYLGPLEATTVHMAQTGILKLFGVFPDRTFNASDSDEYNRLTGIEFERARDFLILHYCATERDDAPLWDHCWHMTIPDALRHKIELFRHSGRVAMLDNEHFGEQSWLSSFVGHNILPRRYDPLADVPDLEDVRRHMRGMAATIRETAHSMPAHDQFLAQFRQPAGASAP